MRYANTFCDFVKDPDGKTVSITGRSIHSGKSVTIKVPLEGLRAYNRGALIQNAFPDLTPDERDFLLSGVGPGEMDAFINNGIRPAPKL